jgi:hypothetical protein
MRLLIEFTPNGESLKRISNEDIALTYQWLGYVFSFGSFRLELSEDYGGYASPSFSDLTVSPEAFESWPPSGDALIKVMLSDGDESEAVTIFDGYGTPESFDEEGAEYTLYSPEYSATIAKDTNQSGTLLSLMTSDCTTLSLTLDSTYARSTSPAVDYTPSSDEKMIDVMAEMCAFFTHGFKIIEGTLYLFDMLTTGTTEDITEFTMQDCEYGKAGPVSLITCDETSIDGSTPVYGSEFNVSTPYHTTTSLIEAALTNIKTIIEKDVVEVESSIGQTSVKVLDDFTVYDESTITPTSTTAKAFSTLYNFDNNKIQIEARGVVA